MSEQHDPLRRTVIAALAGVPLLAMAGAGAPDEALRRTGARTLVAYFSRSGNTRVVAGLIQRSLQADLFEITPQTPYPGDYLQTVEQAREERDSGFEPVLRRTVPNIADYQVLFLGFPIWGTTLPPPLRSFLSAHDLGGKTIVPFITHGGYGLGSSRSVLERHAPKSRVADGFVMQGEQERRTMAQVNAWLNDQDFST